MSTLKEYRDIRIEKLNKLKELGVNPYPAKSDRTHPNSEITENFQELEGKEVVVVGRIFSIRTHNVISFIDIKDASGKIQLYLKEDNFKDQDYKKGELKYEDIGLLDTGDFIEGTGKVTKTKTGQVSVEIEKIRMMAKALRPMPDQWEGFKDVEERYRRRYLDFLSNEDVKKVIDARWKITKEIRKFLWEKGFEEVETPILQPLYGGTNARPFETHFNALDCDFYLRVAPELYLKRLIVGGYEKVFEIAKNFRNEGIDHSHFPEFTMLEWYEAYADYHRVMDLAEEMMKHLVKELTGDTKMKVKEQKIDIGKKWRRVAIEDLMKEELGIDWEEISDEDAKKLGEEHEVKIRGAWDKDKLLFNIYEKVITPKLSDPTWVIDYPMSVSPLSKSHREKPRKAERFEGYIGGVEIFDGWSEIISGLEQRNRFETEQMNMREGDTEAMPLDEDFIETLEYGCPPLGGMGFGIDRLVMFLTDTWAIKDVVAFPTLKPRN